MSQELALTSIQLRSIDTQDSMLGSVKRPLVSPSRMEEEGCLSVTWKGHSGRNTEKEVAREVVEEDIGFEGCVRSERQS